ncbi:MAG: anthranilate synthase component I family protein [Candidatus Kerfeldbacteria bacterium]|nr:anthranilate synthase component I family protein [Candidatus Kerfeldbacteria bacterium]
MFYRKFVQPIEYQPALEAFRQYSAAVPGILFESADIAPVYGRKSLFIVDPVLSVEGRDKMITLATLRPGGDIIRQQLSGEVTSLRSIFEQIQVDDPYFGLYGMFSYDFVRQFEVLPDQHPHLDVPDVQLYIPDLVFVYDHLKETAEVHYYQLTELTLAERLQQLPKQIQSLDFSVGTMQPNINQPEYETLVQRAQDHMKIGDVFELVLSRQFTAPFSGSTLGLYQQYREVNPSPYMFFVRTPHRTLLGASPEMFVRVEAATVMTRPISGTAVRSADAVTDYEHMLALLNSSKEKSELDMLIDLARNDLARVCQPGIQVSDYRYVEKYSKVMHTIAQVTGQLDTDKFIAYDALTACLNAGTLTGAPKIRAMELIEELEPTRRGLYGGCMGYLTFNNELNTGITIRSAVIEDGMVTTQAGATVLLDSTPTAEFKETEHKAAALLGVLAKERL